MAKPDERYQQQKQAWLAHIEAVETAIRDRNQRIEVLEKALEEAHTPQEETTMTTYNITLPPEPEGPIWDKEGDKWERVGSQWTCSTGIGRNWKELLAQWGPVADHPPYELHKRYVSNQLGNLPEGSLLFTLGPYDGVQYVARVMGKWYAWRSDGHDWVFGEAENLDTIAPSFSIHRIGWPEVPAGYDSTLSDLLLIGAEQ